MKAQRTAGHARLTERQKSWARLVLLTVVGLVCPPLAAAKFGAAWAIYATLLVLYSVWTVRVTRAGSQDARLGYLLCLTDAGTLLPILVWSPGVAMRVVLALLCVSGAGASLQAARTRARASHPASHAARQSRSSRPPSTRQGLSQQSLDAPLERAIRERLHLLQAKRERFAIVLLRIVGYKTLLADAGQQATKQLARDVGRRGLRVLGADAQLFLLPGGRMAFVFSTDSRRDDGGPPDRKPSSQVDPYDVETVAMALARRACERELNGHGLECVVGWASAPADGTTADDLMYAAQTGALSSAAFRRVGATHIPVPELEKKRAVAG